MGLYTHNTGKLANKGIRNWRNYYIKPFELNNDPSASDTDVARALNWDANNPSMKITSDFAAGLDLGVQLVSAAGSVMSYWNYLNAASLGAALDGSALNYNMTSPAGTAAGHDDWFATAAPGCHMNFNDISNADSGDIFAFKIPGEDDPRMQRIYFGGYICYVDVPCQMNDIVYTDPLPFTGRDSTFLFNVFGDRLMKSSVDSTTNTATTIFLTTSHDDASDTTKSHTRDHFVDEYDWHPKGSSTVQSSVYDASKDGTIFATDVSGFTNIKQRLKLVFEDDGNAATDEAHFGANQTIAIMVIPH